MSACFADIKLLNMAENTESQDIPVLKIRVTVKTPREKKDVEIDGKVTIKEVKLSLIF